MDNEQVKRRCADHHFEKSGREEKRARSVPGEGDEVQVFAFLR